MYLYSGKDLPLGPTTWIELLKVWRWGCSMGMTSSWTAVPSKSFWKSPSSAFWHLIRPGKASISVRVWRQTCHIGGEWRGEGGWEWWSFWHICCSCHWWGSRVEIQHCDWWGWGHWCIESLVFRPYKMRWMEGSKPLIHKIMNLYSSTSRT
jgi:hypothetical protein